MGGAYIPVGLWAINGRHSSKTPYWLAIIGSAALIILYVLSRTAEMPLVGMQDDIGIIDVGAKVLQGGIIASSLYMIAAIKKENKASLLA